MACHGHISLMGGMRVTRQSLQLCQNPVGSLTDSMPSRWTSVAASRFSNLVDSLSPQLLLPLKRSGQPLVQWYGQLPAVQVPYCCVYEPHRNQQRALALGKQQLNVWPEHSRDTETVDKSQHDGSTRKQRLRSISGLNSLPMRKCGSLIMVSTIEQVTEEFIQDHGRNDTANGTRGKRETEAVTLRSAPAYHLSSLTTLDGCPLKNG